MEPGIAGQCIDRIATVLSVPVPPPEVAPRHARVVAARLSALLKVHPNSRALFAVALLTIATHSGGQTPRSATARTS